MTTSPPALGAPAEAVPPLSGLLASPRQFTQYLEQEGRLVRQGISAWLSYLPEYEAHAFRRTPEFSCLDEWVRKVTGLGSTYVQRARRLGRNIGKYRGLMDYWRSGGSMRKLEVVGPHVGSHDDARKFLGWLQARKTVRELEALLERGGYRRRSRRGLRRVSAAMQERGADTASTSRSGSEVDSGEHPGARSSDRRYRLSLDLPAATAHDWDLLAKLEAEVAGYEVPRHRILAALLEARIDYLVRAKAAGKLTRDDALRPAHVMRRKPLSDRADEIVNLGLTPAKLGRRLPYVRVVVEEPEKGRLRWRSRYGLVDVEPRELEGREELARIRHGDLVDEARTASAEAGGEAVPAASLREVLLDSSGLCEADGCKEWLEEIHHVRRRGASAEPDHSDLEGLCGVHHRVEHHEPSEPDGPDAEADRAHRQILEKRRSDGSGGEGKS